MNFDFGQQINPYLSKLDFENAVAIGELELKKIPDTVFHHIIGKSLTNQAESLADWVEDFYKIISKKFEVKAFYFEMNEFDINTELWYIDNFAFSKDGGLDLKDMEWLCYFEADSQTETDTFFIIDDLEELQTAFETIETDTEPLQNARDWCEQLIIARFMELMRTAHLVANEKRLAWAAIPIYFTEHEYDFIVRSEN